MEGGDDSENEEGLAFTIPQPMAAHASGMHASGAHASGAHLMSPFARVAGDVEGADGGDGDASGEGVAGSFAAAMTAAHVDSVEPESF